MKIALARIVLSVQNHPRNTRRLDFQTLNSVCSSRGILHNGNRDGTPRLMEVVHTVPLSKNEMFVAKFSNTTLQILQMKHVLHRDCLLSTTYLPTRMALLHIPHPHLQRDHSKPMRRRQNRQDGMGFNVLDLANMQSDHFSGLITLTLIPPPTDI